MSRVTANARTEHRTPVPYKGPAPKTRNGKKAYNRTQLVFNHTSTLVLDRSDFEDRAGLTAPCTVLLSPKTNCVVLVNGPRAHGTEVKPRGNLHLIKVVLAASIVPPLAYSVEVRDVLLDRQGLLIVRWPLWLYTQSIRTVRDFRRSVRGQQRESEFIEAAYRPLTERPEPYPFFVPLQPLDPFWPPAT